MAGMRMRERSGYFPGVFGRGKGKPGIALERLSCVAVLKRIGSEREQNGKELRRISGRNSAGHCPERRKVSAGQNDN